MVNAKLTEFIVEARKRGFDDYEIRKPLIANGWPPGEIEAAFISLKPKPEHKHQLCFYLDSEVLKKLEKRAKRNMFTLEEQVADIIRRSVANAKHAQPKEKLDDMLVTLFSRKRR
jgi:hypothetical protein